MKDSSTYFEIKSSGEIFPKQTNIGRTPYNHQKEAMSNLDCINRSSSYSTLIVLPTGGGKTYTASMWLLKNAIDNNKKILWIAHRQMLLDQAADSFMKYAYAEIIPHISSFRFRIVSGSSSHDRAVNIDSKDNLLIVSKDSIGRNLQRLDCWLKNEEEVYLIIDEAHHSTAKTYRKVIEYVKKKVKNVKLIGLTATPFRTAENEKGLLSKIYSDGVKNGIVFHNDIGITYQIGLKELIKRQILSKPVFEDYYSDEQYGLSLGVDALEKIQNLDLLPEDIKDKMQNSAGRNKLIVETYKKNQNTYGQTIVFSVSVVHAIQLAAQFNKAGIKADYVVSDIKDSVTGVTVSREDNERKIEAYRQGKLQVLTNVNILTEGVDLPQTKTVFLARPTVSAVLMTQMVGRALRGVLAGGTPEAYIVSFIDKWNDINELRKSMPNLGTSVTVDYMLEEIAVAETSHSRRCEFLAKYCNIKQNASTAWFEAPLVQSMFGTDYKLEDFRNSYGLGGLDLSQTTDLTSACILIEREGVIWICPISLSIGKRSGRACAFRPIRVWQ